MPVVPVVLSSVIGRFVRWHAVRLLQKLKKLMMMIMMIMATVPMKNDEDDEGDRASSTSKKQASERCLTFENLPLPSIFFRATLMQILSRRQGTKGEHYYHHQAKVNSGTHTHTVKGSETRPITGQIDRAQLRRRWRERTDLGTVAALVSKQCTLKYTTQI